MGDGIVSPPILTRVLWGLSLGCLVACAATPPAPPPVAGAGDVIALHPRANPALELDTEGTVGPRRALSAADRGFGEYDSELQSSLFLCAGTGPAAGPCLAVLGGLFALAGATSSLVYGAVEGDVGRSATRRATEAFSAQPAIAALSARIAAAAAARAAAADRTLDVATADCSGDMPGPSGSRHFDLDIAAMKLDFTPGPEFRLTLVARLTERDCAGTARGLRQRLAYLGPVTPLSWNHARAAAAFADALDAAVVALGAEVDLYFQGKRAGGVR